MRIAIRLTRALGLDSEQEMLRYVCIRHRTVKLTLAGPRL